MKILTALDRSEYAEIVLEHGLDQAMQNPEAELHFVTVAVDGDDEATLRTWLDAAVREGLDSFGIPGRPVVLHVRRGRPAPAIGALAIELGADLIVVGRFHTPSESDVLVDIVECPTLVVGLEGHVLEPQCPACREARRATGAEQLFCEAHRGGELREVITRLPPSTSFGSRMW